MKEEGSGNRSEITERTSGFGKYVMPPALPLLEHLEPGKFKQTGRSPRSRPRLKPDTPHPRGTGPMFSRSPWLLCFVPRRGYRTQPRVSTLGIVHQERRAPKGRQIERPNKMEAVGWFNCRKSQLRTLTFAWQHRCEVCLVPASLAPSG